MKRFVASILFAAVMVAYARAQTGTIKTQSQLDSEISAFFPDQTAGQITPFNTRQTLLDMVASAGQFGLPIADPRNFTALPLVCSGGINASTGIAAAIAAGFNRIRLPAGCFYQPPTVSGSEVVPAGIQIIGDNWDPNLGLFSQIQTANRLTSTDFLQLGKGASIQNVAVQSNFCDQQTNPFATQKLCPLKYALNIGDQAQSITNWAYEVIFLTGGTSTTQPGGIVSTDTPLFAVEQNNLGDGIFASISGGGTAIRVQTQSSVADVGVLVSNGIVNPTVEHFGFDCAEFTTFSGTPSGGCVKLSRQNGSIYPLLFVTDVGPTTYTTNLADYLISFASGGNLWNWFQTLTPFSGNFININAGNSGGTCTGNFANFQLAAVTKTTLTCSGNAIFAGTLTSGTSSGGATGSLTLNGATSGAAVLATASTGGHLTYAGSGTAPTLTAGCNGTGSSISGTDINGTVTGQTAVATSCTVTFGTAYGAAPRCVPTGRTTPVTSYSTSTTALVLNFASTASAVFDWTCYGT